MKRIFSYYGFLIFSFIFLSALLISSVANEMNQMEILALSMCYYGGPTDCVALQGDYAYIGEETGGLHILLLPSLENSAIQ